MSTRNNNNNNNNNKDISKINNTVSPLTTRISKNKTSNSSLGTSNNQLDVGWTIQKSKRNLSSSTNSEPNSPGEQPPKSKKKKNLNQLIVMKLSLLSKFKILIS